MYSEEGTCNALQESVSEIKDIGVTCLLEGCSPLISLFLHSDALVDLINLMQLETCPGIKLETNFFDYSCFPKSNTGLTIPGANHKKNKKKTRRNHEIINIHHTLEESKEVCQQRRVKLCRAFLRHIQRVTLSLIGGVCLSADRGTVTPRRR